ncbi:toll/interleukin-1 receptor domain-containing protein [uncultured Variovorax sp.]|uniref:toll/interleukin-1 receptor domain-containing protein n=1 Tax=uncultured Variovorax sp. TaxID=114708 RepID=UPI0025E006E4|nr:toll/interleukin-1 receptor domain-containing protein [uncultured Variovorax sp.]
MRATERMDLLEKIGTELQSRYTFTDIDGFFGALGIRTQDFEYGGSKRVYAKEVLKFAEERDVLRVADELGLLTGPGLNAAAQPPANWQDTKAFRLFISHVSKDKQIATRLKGALAAYDIAGFVAHEDIHPTLAWQDEIERALVTMDALIAVHTVGFSASMWCQQEVGFALGRGTKVISFKMGEDPTGFIGKHQALPRRNRTAEQIAEEVDKLLEADPRTRERLDEARAAAVPF